MDRLPVYRVSVRGDEHFVDLDVLLFSTHSEIAFQPFDGARPDRHAAGLTSLSGGRENA